MSALWHPAYVGVGSNLGDPQAQVHLAYEKLARVPQTQLVLTSPLYRSRPMGPIAQGDFVNGAAALLTQLDSHALLNELHAIEASLGRPIERQRWGPRVIDLDLLIFGREQHQGSELTLPHAGLVERNFVLYPLADMAPDLDVPGRGRVTELAARLGRRGLWAL